MTSRFSSGDRLPLEKIGICLRAGQHRLVDVLRLDAAELGGVAAARQRAAGAGEVVAGGAVGQEDLAAADDGLLALLVGQALDAVVGLVGDRRAGAERGDVRRERRDLLVGVDGGLAAGPGRRAGPSASGRCRPGSRRRRRRRRPAAGRSWLPSLVRDALAVLAVAEGAADEEELAALGRPARRRSPRGRACAGANAAYSAAGQQQAEQQDQRGPRAGRGGAARAGRRSDSGDAR